MSKRWTGSFSTVLLFIFSYPRHLCIERWVRQTDLWRLPLHGLELHSIEPFYSFRAESLLLPGRRVFWHWKAFFSWLSFYVTLYPGSWTGPDTSEFPPLNSLISFLGQVVVHTMHRHYYHNHIPTCSKTMDIFGTVQTRRARSPSTYFGDDHVLEFDSI